MPNSVDGDSLELEQETIEHKSMATTATIRAQGRLASVISVDLNWLFGSERA